MASWMVHLRIADRLLDQIPGLVQTEFIVGNIAPDSGVPNADWSSFMPSTKISHFKTETTKAGPQAFAAKYFTPRQQAGYSGREYSFYLGYLCHLLTDVLWSEQIALPSFRRYLGGEPPYRGPQADKIKEDWYDLDHRFLRDHPGFRAFQIYLEADGFVNGFMEEFSPDAFDDRRRYITAFYLQGNDRIDREYPYLSEAEMDSFVEEASHAIMEQLPAYTLRPFSQHGR